MSAATYTRMPKNGQDVLSIAEALKYASAAGSAAGKLCPTALLNYNKAYTQASVLKAQNIAGTSFESQYLPALRSALVAADKICSTEKMKKGSETPLIPPYDPPNDNTLLWLIGAAIVGIGGVVIYKKTRKKGKRR